MGMQSGVGYLIKIFTLDHDKTGDGKIDIEDLDWHYLQRDGDFRSKEVKKLRDEADIIITNPPFSVNLDNETKKNVGINTQDEYTVKLFKSEGIELASLDITESIAPDETVTHDLSWNIPSNEPTGPTAIYGQVFLTGDENSNNDLTSYLDIMVYPEGLIIVLEEGFEGGVIPGGWSQEIVVGTTEWTYINGGHSSNPAAAHTGSFNAHFYNSSDESAKLITPEINLGTANEGILTFWHTQAVWAGDQDELKIYYKTSSGGTWILLEHYTENITAWTERIITLPDPSTTYYVAFEGIGHYGYGVCIDDVIITGNPTVYDRLMAFDFTIKAVDYLFEHKDSNKVVIYNKGCFDFMDIQEVVSNKYQLPKHYLDAINYLD